MDYYAMADQGIAEELGKRFRELRLRRNLTQKELAGAVMVSLNVIKALESGQGKLSTVIAVLRELEGLDSLDRFIPQVTISPLQLAKQKGKKRQRASGKRGDKDTEKGVDW